MVGLNQQTWGYNANLDQEIRLTASNLQVRFLLGKLHGKLTKFPCGYHLRIRWRNPASSHPRPIFANTTPAVPLYDWLSVSICLKQTPNVSISWMHGSPCKRSVNHPSHFDICILEAFNCSTNALHYVEL